jgi:hypothetical protein
MPVSCLCHLVEGYVESHGAAIIGGARACRAVAQDGPRPDGGALHSGLQLPGVSTPANAFGQCAWKDATPEDPAPVQRVGGNTLTGRATHVGAAAGYVYRSGLRLTGS